MAESDMCHIHNKADLPSATVYGMRRISRADCGYSRLLRFKELRNTKCDNKYLRQCLEFVDQLTVVVARNRKMNSVLQ